jgi:ABC-type Fe3+ transport system permease subunit
VAWVLAGPIAAPGLLTSHSWLLGAIPAIVAGIGLFWWLRVYRNWNDSMLQWRLRRRKHGAVLDALMDDE